MDYRNLGRSGLEVSAVGLGCMNFGTMNDEAESTAIVQRALDLGVNLFDTADVYGDRGKSEQYLGRALGARRPGSHYRHQVRRADVQRSASHAGRFAALHHAGGRGEPRRLGTDYIDLYQMHRYDDHAPMEETLRALDDLVRQGKVRYVGCSNYAAWQITDADWTARSEHLNRFISVQNRYSLLTRDIEKEVVPACREVSGSASCRTSRWRVVC